MYGSFFNQEISAFETKHSFLIEIYKSFSSHSQKEALGVDLKVPGERCHRGSNRKYQSFLLDCKKVGGEKQKSAQKKKKDR